jgi:hypothetical protein
MTKAVMWLFLVGCAFDPAPMSTPAPPLEAQFDLTVAPLLAAKCAGCHADFDFTSIVASPALSGDGDPADSLLLTKGPHEGPAWSPAEVTAILTWLDALAGHGG